jgi:hypothetical protein
MATTELIKKMRIGAVRVEFPDPINAQDLGTV